MINRLKKEHIIFIENEMQKVTLDEFRRKRDKSKSEETWKVLEAYIYISFMLTIPLFLFMMFNPYFSFLLIAETCFLTGMAISELYNIDTKYCYKVGGEQ